MYKLLIVDDEQFIIDGLQKTLDWQAMGISRIETAKNYQQAIDLAIEIEPDIAIFDVCLKDCYGYDIINKLNDLNLKTKYIMISGYDQFEFARQALNCGASSYLLKPVDRAELKHRFEKIIVNDLGGKLPAKSISFQTIDPVLNVECTKMSKLINKIITIVKSNCGSNLSLKSVADLFKMNSAYLGQLFLKETGIKFSEYLMIYRMLAAKEMLINSNDKISYIAKKVGYSNLNYFYLHFKSYYNISPSDIREGHSKAGCQ